MKEEEWRRERDDRTIRYAGRVLDPANRIVIRADGTYAHHYAGQVAILTLANLLSRMTPNVRLDLPKVRTVRPLPWPEQNLVELTLHTMRSADPFGQFDIGSSANADCLLTVGARGPGLVIHGSGWRSYVGLGPSPLGENETANPVGPAFASILCASQLFVHRLRPPTTPLIFNTLRWEENVGHDSEPVLPSRIRLGEIWCVGVGSVGTAILYFLSLITRDFSATLFDMDTVKTHNLDRSPMFVDKDVGTPKVAAAARYLNSAGVDRVLCEHTPLHESPLFVDREEGAPDLMISAANEQNVRYVIESTLPPIQIYGTTGNSWQAAVIRHVPIAEACSCCLFPASAQVPTRCAQGEMQEPEGSGHVDAALPFLSFGAGLMAAAEILKLTLPGYPLTANRVVFNTKPRPRFVHAEVPRRIGCVCSTRSTAAHHRMIGRTFHESLSS